VSSRGWLQEDLTATIGKKISRIADSKSVYVALFNMKHGCASFRGAKDTQAATSTIYKTGRFADESNLVPLKYQG
jgi:GTP cyclohydrolase I